MITAFNSTEIYTGRDVTEYNRICDILEENKIPYKIYLSEDELPKQWYNVRGHGSTIGIDSKELYEYSVCIRKEDMVNAKRLIG